MKIGINKENMKNKGSLWKQLFFGAWVWSGGTTVRAVPKNSYSQYIKKAAMEYCHEKLEMLALSTMNTWLLRVKTI